MTGKRTPVAISAENYEWLQDTSERTGIPVSKLVGRAIAEFMTGEGARLLEVLGK